MMEELGSQTEKAATTPRLEGRSLWEREPQRDSLAGTGASTDTQTHPEALPGQRGRQRPKLLPSSHLDAAQVLPVGRTQPEATAEAAGTGGHSGRAAEW